MSNKNNPNASQRQMDVDWSNWSGKCDNIEHSLSQPVERDCHKGGEHVTKDELRKEAEKIIQSARQGPLAQATDEQLFGHLVKSNEELEQMEKDWENFFNDTLGEARKPVDEKVAKELPPELLEEAWPSGTSFNDMLSAEEVEKRGKYIGH